MSQRFIHTLESNSPAASWIGSEKCGKIDPYHEITCGACGEIIQAYESATSQDETPSWHQDVLLLGSNRGRVPDGQERIFLSSNVRHRDSGIFELLEDEQQTEIPHEIITVDGLEHEDSSVPVWLPDRERFFPNRDQVVAAYDTKDSKPLVIAFHRGCFDARADAIDFHCTGKAPSRNAIDRLNLIALYDLDCSRYEEPEDEYASGLKAITRHGNGDAILRHDEDGLVMADPSKLDAVLLPQASDHHDFSTNMACRDHVLAQQPWLANFARDDAAWNKVDWQRVAAIDWTPSAAPHALASFANRARIFKLWLLELGRRSPLGLAAAARL